MNRLHVAAFCLIIAWSASWTCRSAHGEKAQSLDPDLTFHFDCEGAAYPPSDIAIENFLRNHGFRVLNKVRLAKKHHVEFPFDLYIVGIDRRRRMIQFMSIPVPTVYFTAILNSPPPTQHDSDLEEAILAFVANKLGCPTKQIRRGENGDDAQSFYDYLFKMREGWFRQSDDIERPPT